MALVGHISGSSQSNSIIGISGSVIVANRPNGSFPSFPGSDVSFFVSGSTDGRNEGYGVSTFGGQLVVSGAALLEGGVYATTVSGSGDFDVGGNLTVAGDITINGNDIKSSTGDIAIQLTGSSVTIPGDLTVNGTTVSVNTTNLEIKDSLIGLGFSSGSIAEANGDRGFIGGLLTGDDVSIFWDNSASEFAVARTDSTPDNNTVNITSYAQFHALGLTGSLTKLSDGTDYLRAGANISLTTGSSGEVTVAVTGMATGDVVGPASATNDAVAVYDGTTGKLIKNSNLSVGTRTTTQNYVTASVNLTDYGLALIPSGTGPLSARAPDGTTIGGDARGTNAVDFQMVRNDPSQVASGIRSVIVGGQRNRAVGESATIVGGSQNAVSARFGFIGSGEFNSAGEYSFIGTGGSNSCIAERSFIGAGNSNSIASGISRSAIVNGNQNSMTAAGVGATEGQFIGNGKFNSIKHTFSSIVGGESNTASSTHTFIGGGNLNVVSGSYSVVVGGQYNSSSNDYVFIGGGQYNTGSGRYSSVVGGLSNTAQSYGETSFGLYSTTGAGNQVSYVSTDRLFVVGNGTSSTARSNALTLIKNGDMHLSGTLTLMSGSTSGITFPSTRGSNGQVLTSDGAGLITWQTPTVQPSYFSSTTVGSIYTTGSMAFVDGEVGIDSPSDKGSDVWFYVSGSTDGTKNALFGGDIVTSGSLSVLGNTTLGNTTSDLITFNARVGTDFLPANDNQYNLGSATNRWANVYTGDLHLRNDRGDWTVIEEETYLSIRNNKTGKLYKFMMEPVGE